MQCNNSACERSDSPSLPGSTVLAEHVLAAMESPGEPERVPADGDLDDRLLWVGPDDRGIVLEVMAVDLPDYLLVVHAMPVGLRRN